MGDRPVQVYYSPDVRNLDEWATRLNLPLSVDSLGAHYARAHRWLNSLKGQLVQNHAWKEISSTDPRILFIIEAEPLRPSNALPCSPSMNITLPSHASSFFSPERRVQWQMVFHSALFQGSRHTIQPVGSLLNLLQCLIPGMLLLAKEEDKPEGVWTTTRALPPPDWVNAHQSMLVEIFGSSHYKKLFKAASDNRIAFKVNRGVIGE